ncbi:MAG: hypothetical protein WCS94_22985 [Verrucomicrobiota bacterium]
MDKRRKTRWERKMKLLKIVLVIFLPLLFGLTFWLVSRMNPFGK